MAMLIRVPAALLLLTVVTGITQAQYQYDRPQPSQTTGQPQYSQPQHGAGQMGQPVSPPQQPTLQRRGASQQAPPAPFSLTPQQQAQLDWVLNRWEQHGSRVKTFESGFTRFEYDGIFNSDPNSARFVDTGELKYVAPDKGMFRINTDARKERWICDGKSIFEYDYQKKQVVEYNLPPELQGRAIAEGPMPFFFAAKAQQLRDRYFLRVVTPQAVKGQVWLEAHPRFQGDAANFRQATLILTLDDMQPFAVEMQLPNGKSRTVFRFENARINARNLLDPLKMFENNWLHAEVPNGWTRRVEDPPVAQAGRPPLEGQMR